MNALKNHISPPFPFLYYLACVLLFVVALPFLIVSSFRSKHRDSIPARFFPWHIKKLEYEPYYWFHACSFGEIRSLQPLLSALSTESAPILITTITHTGYKEAKRLYEQTYKAPIMVRYLPFEIFLFMWGRHCTKLKTLVVTEAEMWKMLFYFAKSHNARTLLLNARISERSLKSYERFAWFYRGVFALIDEVLAQSHKDKQRLEDLGARSVEVFGNLKTLNTPLLSTHYAKPNLPVFIAASTHKGEELLVLEAFKQYKDGKNALLLLAPRHPERFKEVYELSKSMFAHTTLFSNNALEGEGDVIVVDVLGELNNLYAISDVVILGGSFVKNVGGHNPLEPAFFGARLISGEHIFNQYALFEEVANYVLIPPQSLFDTLNRWESLLPTSLNVSSHKKLNALVAKIQYEQR